MTGQTWCGHQFGHRITCRQSARVDDTELEVEADQPDHCHADTNAGYKVSQNAHFAALRFTGLIRSAEKQYKAKDIMKFFGLSD